MATYKSKRLNVTLTEAQFYMLRRLYAEYNEADEKGTYISENRRVADKLVSAGLATGWGANSPLSYGRYQITDAGRDVINDIVGCYGFELLMQAVAKHHRQQAENAKRNDLRKTYASDMADVTVKPIGSYLSAEFLSGVKVTYSYAVSEYHVEWPKSNYNSTIEDAQQLMRDVRNALVLVQRFTNELKNQPAAQ